VIEPSTTSANEPEQLIKQVNKTTYSSQNTRGGSRAAKRLKKLSAREVSKEIKLLAQVDQRLRYAHSISTNGKAKKSMKIEESALQLEIKAMFHHNQAARALQALASMRNGIGN